MIETKSPGHLQNTIEIRLTIARCQDSYLLRSLEHYLIKVTGVPVYLVENPLTCVVLGTGRYFDELKYIKPGIR